jgi:excisionase family DNA binding protein
MAEFWSIKEVANYLGVDYKTVYRLVRKGDIPAGKVGGVYRIRRDDVDAYFERQKLQVLEEEETEEDHIKCAVCLRLLDDASEIGGRCRYESCTVPICEACWNTKAVRYCPGHRPSRDQKLSAAQQKLKAGEIPLLVTTIEAKQRELGFITQFDRKVHRIVKLRNPLIEDVVYPPFPWEELHTSQDDSERLMDLLRTGYLEEDVERELPLNAVSRYTIPPEDAKGIGLILEARVLSHLPAIVRQGFDTRPATLAELLRVLEICIEKVEASPAAYLVGIAATTGWTAEARGYIEGRDLGRSFSHNMVLPYLIDLHEMTLIYNEADQRLIPLAPLFTPYLPEDQLTSITEYIRQRLQIYDSLSLTEVAEQMKTPLETVKEATDKLVANADYRTYEVEGIGTVISFSKER